MSGFVGLISARGDREDELRTAVRRMTRALSRGHDPVGSEWLDSEAGAALATVETHAAKPTRGSRRQRSRMASSASGRWVLLFEGELYNHRELYAMLTGEASIASTPGAAELALAAFEHWGVEAGVERFNGSFVIALWDTSERRLTLIRDRIGIKQLFVTVRDGWVIFGTELRAIIAAPGVERAVDPVALTHYLRHLYVGAPRTIFRGISRLEPGHILTITDPAGPLPAAVPYWSLREVAERGIANPFEGSAEEAAEEMSRILADAVRLQMQVDPSPGALLSGGIDSSAVVAVMQEQASHPVKTFTAAFDVAEHNEAEHAAEVAKHLGTDHTEFLLTGEDALAIVPQLPEVFDEPNADASQIGVYLACSFTCHEVDVALLGSGGDELYGGYNRYTYGETTMQRLVLVPWLARQLAAGVIGTLSATSWDRVYQRLAPVLPSRFQQRLAGEKLVKMGLLMAGRSTPQMYRALLSAWQQPDQIVIGAEEEEGVLEEVLSAESPGQLVDRMMLADQLTYLPGDQLVIVERVSKATGLHIRTPLFDHRQVEFSWRVPTELKISNGRGKVLLREALYQHIPREQIERPKVGFSIPLQQWLCGPLRPWVEELLSPEALGRDGSLRAAPIRDAWQRYQNGRSELALSLWAVVVYQAWRERWLGA